MRPKEFCYEEVEFSRWCARTRWKILFDSGKLRLCCRAKGGCRRAEIGVRGETWLRRRIRAREGKGILPPPRAMIGETWPGGGGRGLQLGSADPRLTNFSDAPPRPKRGGGG